LFADPVGEDAWNELKVAQHACGINVGDIGMVDAFIIAETV
jgi:hypothetical protein